MRLLTVVIIGLVLLMQYQIWLAKGSLPQVWRLKQQLHEEIAKNKTLLNRNEALAAEVSNLKVASSALEERARSDLGMIRDGEVYYQIVPKHQRRIPLDTKHS